VLGRPLNWLMGWSFWAFNVGFDTSTLWYTRAVGGLLRVSVLVLVVYGGLLYLTYWGFQRTPAGFIPQQDKGYLLVNVQLPDAASLERTEAVMREIEGIVREAPGVKHTVAIAGQSLLLGANAPNFGAMYVMLDDFHHRTAGRLTGDVIGERLQRELQDRIRGGVVNIFGAPPVEGLGTAGGFKIIIEDRGDTGLDSLQEVAEKTVERAQGVRGVGGLFTSFRANTPWLYLDVDRVQAKTLNVSMAELFAALQVNLGSLYVNDFNRFGRTWQVNVQASEGYRAQLKDLTRIKVRNGSGQMVPLSALVRVREVPGPIMVARYNLYPAAAVNGNAAEGASSGQAIARMEAAAKTDLPASMRAEWTELAFLQLNTGKTAMMVFLVAVVLVFLVLAAQYESLSLPLAVILVVPMCLLCSVAAVAVARLDINIFTQVGFVVLIGLACKNAILIVEFAKKEREKGVPRDQATLEACQLRLRPIIMTSFAFVLGVVPLVVAEGAGAEMRRTLGTAVFGGMLGVTLFGIFLTPVFYFVIQWLNDLRTPETDGTAKGTAGRNGPGRSFDG
jgi:hydrophobe/amphiphile efflux-1 (HAE1) family protein